ncbi:Hypothetical predicted protein [Pelobates cultripes]|uniref:Uncharacterized protein n=1 Tax=Pelobates cultripes TaxID=61616 RepID=A0AAD1S430_PELCU|nr:Hypothetical predicted protein [Pelobates cultripes]
MAPKKEKALTIEKKKATIGTYYSPKMASTELERQRKSLPLENAEVSAHQMSNLSEEDFPHLPKISQGMTQQLLTQMLDNLYKKIKDDIEHNTNDIRSEIFILSEKLSSQAIILQKVQDDYEHIKLSNAQLEKKLQDIENKITNFEDRSRRNNIRVRGISETITQEDLYSYLDSFFSNILSLQTLGPEWFERFHSLPKSNGIDKSNPRDVIVCFSSFRIKNLIMQKVRNKIPDTDEWRHLKIFQDLSQKTRQARRTFSEETTILRNMEIRYKWLFPMAIMVFFRDQSYIFRDNTALKEKMTIWKLIPNSN